LGLMKPWPSASMLWNRDLTASLKMWSIGWISVLVPVESKCA
jgi:hypothetical protein